MACLFPLEMHRTPEGVVQISEKGSHTSFYVPCGQCGECRLSRARMWATRCVHEASMWKHSSFITLTYKDPPPGNSLEPEDTRNFIRRLRQKIGPHFKYFLAGEYGEKGDRPHYHALIFGTDFGLSNHYETDQKKRQSSPLQILSDTDALHSPILDEIWGLGYTSVGHLTFDSAAYTAQYAIKKINGAPAKSHYQGRKPEFMRQSKKAIGLDYALTYADEIINHNSVLSNGTEQPIPPYYLKKYDQLGKPLDALKQLREEYSSQHTLEKSYTRALNLDAKFKLKASKADKFRIKYAKDLYHRNVTEPAIPQLSKKVSK